MQHPGRHTNNNGDDESAFRFTSRSPRPSVCSTSAFDTDVDDSRSGLLLRQSRSTETPWERDKRVTPRSVRTPPSKYGHNNKIVNNNPFNKSRNPFDSSPSSSNRSANPSRIVSRNNNNNNNNNPFDQSSSHRDERAMGRGIITTVHSSEEGRTKRRSEPFDSPTPTLSHHHHRDSSNNNNTDRNSSKNTFDGSSPLEVRQTITATHHQDRQLQTTTSATKGISVTPGTTNKNNTTSTRSRVVGSGGVLPNSPVKHDSVALDSLEQILDTTDETDPIEEEDIPLSENEASGVLFYPQPYYPPPLPGGPSRSRSLSTPTTPSHYHQASSPFGTPQSISTATTYDDDIDNSSRGNFYDGNNNSTKKVQTPPTTTTTSTPTTSSANTYGDDVSNDTSPSDKALRAAERLRHSFQQRRRRSRSQTRGEDNTPEDEENDNDCDDYNPTNRGGNNGDDPMKDDHDDNEDDVDTTLDGLNLEYSKTEEESMPNATNTKRATTVVNTTKSNSGATIQKQQLHRGTGKLGDEEKKDDGDGNHHLKGNYNLLRDSNVKEQGGNGDNNDNDDEESHSSGDYALHDLCDEAPSTDDIAWRNALFLLTVRPDLATKKEPEGKMTPLHVACLAHEPPPLWFTRGVLYTAPATCGATDNGGRLPLHLLVATSADLDTIRLLVEEYPPSVAHRDNRGFTPLQLLLKNDKIILTLEHLTLLLGRVDGTGSSTSNITRRGAGNLVDPKNYPGRSNNGDRQKRLVMSFRKGEHLSSSVSDLNAAMADTRNRRHESQFGMYPNDVRVSLNRITQWKRRQANKSSSSVQSKTIRKQLEVERQFLHDRMEEFTNPAAIATPTGQLLPLHLLIRRKNSAIDGDNVKDNMGTPVKRASIADLLRVLIAAHPQGLSGKDANGKTPLMTALLRTDGLPSADVVEQLLGLRSPGFDVWNKERPAVIATDDTYQLPLHIAAEELLHDYSLLSTIFEAYPDGRSIQDMRGRTPLHLAFQNYRSVPIDRAILSLLYSEAVAKMKDDDGKTPFDLMVENPNCVREPTNDDSFTPSSSTTTIFQQFLDDSIEKPKNRREAQILIQKFRGLPPWLRRQACAAKFVQEILIHELASPYNTFRVLGSGFVIVVLTALLRRLLTVNTNLAILVYYLATYHLTVQLLHFFTTLYMGECVRLCITNIWRWIDIVAGVLAICCAHAATAAAASSSSSDASLSSTYDENNNNTSNLGAAATAFCWLSLLGFMIDWCCGVAVFVGTATQLLYALVWPLIVATMGIVATSQVLYTLEDCPTGSICSLSDAYSVVYAMILGEPILVTNTDGYDYSNGTIATVIVFTLLWVWWILSVVGITITEAHKLDRRQLALSWYWEPKVTVTVMATSSSKGNKKKGTMPIGDVPTTWIDRYCDGMEKYWDILASALLGQTSTVHWHVCCFRSNAVAAIVGCMALIILPLWVVLGLLTLGVLWPPQVRRWLFRPDIATTVRRQQRSGKNIAGVPSRFMSSSTLPYDTNGGDDATRGKLSQLRTDIVELKAVAYDQNHTMQKDLSLIKEMLLGAVTDDAWTMKE